MKKIIASLSLSLAAITSFAAGPVVGLTYDYNRANTNAQGFNSYHQGQFNISQDIGFGSVDGALILQRDRGASTDSAHGFEVGYSNGLSFGQVGLKGRVAYGRLNGVDPNGGGFVGNQNYLSLGAEAAMPVTTSINGFVGYEHQKGFNTDTPAQNRFTGGVDYALNKQIAFRLGYAHTRQAGFVYNGVTTGVSYAF